MARYSDEFRANAILMLEAAGYPDKRGALMQVSRVIGVKHSTLSRWFRRVRNEVPLILAQKKAFDLMQAIRDELQAIMSELPIARPDADYKELTTSLGILVDKLQLLEGKATERVELLTEQERTDRLAAILDTARSRRDRRSVEVLQ